MKWTTAVSLARSCDDVTYEEWCALYYWKQTPSATQHHLCCETAHVILVRNGVIGNATINFTDEPNLTVLDI